MENLNDLPINAIDIGVIAILLLSALFAYMRGFVHEVLSIAGWVGASLITIYAFPYIKPYARDFISVNLVADLAGGTVVFILSLVVLSLITRSISQGIRNSALNILDRSLGFLFGLLRGVLIVCVGFIILELFIPRDKLPNWVMEARSMELIIPGSEMLTSLIPDESRKDASDKAGEAKSKAEKLIDDSKVVRDLLLPAPKGTGKDRSGTYNSKERQQMQRLIENSQ